MIALDKQFRNQLAKTILTARITAEIESLEGLPVPAPHAWLDVDEIDVDPVPADGRRLQQNSIHCKRGECEADRTGGAGSAGFGWGERQDQAEL